MSKTPDPKTSACARRPDLGPAALLPWVSMILASLAVAVEIHAAPPARDWAVGLRIEITDLGSCRGCAGSIERALARLDGVASAVLDAETPTIVVGIEDGVAVDLAGVRPAVRDVGYAAGRIELHLVGRFEREGESFQPRWPEASSLAVSRHQVARLADAARRAARSEADVGVRALLLSSPEVSIEVIEIQELAP